MERGWYVTCSFSPLNLLRVLRRGFNAFTVGIQIYYYSSAVQSHRLLYCTYPAKQIYVHLWLVWITALQVKYLYSFKAVNSCQCFDTFIDCYKFGDKAVEIFGKSQCWVSFGKCSWLLSFFFSYQRCRISLTHTGPSSIFSVDVMDMFLWPCALV